MTAETTRQAALDRWRVHDWELIAEEPTAPTMNMALDEVLTLAVGDGSRRPALRIWGWTQRCVVLGRFQSVRNEIHEEAANDRRVELVRRISGGGAMFIEPEGAITYSIFAPEELVQGLSFADSYAFMDAWVIEALRELGIDAWYQPLNDITSQEGKIGGAAQARRGGAILHHTTMAYHMNIPLMLEVLRIGQEKLSDKGIRSADKRVGPLSQQTGLTRGDIIDHLIATFDRRHGLSPGGISDDERLKAKSLVDSKFGTRDWTYSLS